VAFVRPSGDGRGAAGADLFIRSLADGSETKVAHDAVSIGNVSWAPDAAHLAYSGGSQSIRHDQTPEYSGVKIIYTITERTPGQTYVVPARGGKPVAIGTPGGGGPRWVDGARLVFDRQSSDYKRRTISVADIAGGAPKATAEDVDDKFWSIPGGAAAAAQPSPDGKWIAFLSDRDGWDHLYVMPSAGGDAVQITRGRFEAWRPSWSPDSTRIAFDANEADRPGTRHLGVATIGTDPSKATVAMLTSGRGTNIAPVWSPDGTRLVYQRTDPQTSADFFVVSATGGGKPARLSTSMPASMTTGAFVEPELVHYPGPDGQQVPGWLFVPKDLDRSKTHPAIVWIHGDGVNQSYDGWHVQRNYAVYYSFHQYLLDQGYVVFAPDYRGSIGYGRAWRQGVYMDVGGKDAQDAWMAAHYLKTLGYVDPDRLGVWGLSYGGFFTLIAMTAQPTLYRAGVNVAGVVDYAMYYEDPYHGGWTASRIGTPEQNPAVYKQASPLSHVDRLARPLLILHGTADVNVPYLHSVRLVDELMAKGKSPLFDFMMYPGEFHYFTRAHVLRDAWQRVDEFFAKHLRASGATS
jgi:dipeptidyl aminopeptidase/acylaminoacyl peptidase